MVKASAQRPELVQILLVAFSRRICCSRVESVSTKPRLPSASTVSPHKPAGHLAQEFLARGEQADIGSAEIEAVADGLAFAGDDVGALRARRLEKTQRHDFRHHRDQQRALGMGGLGDGTQIADQAEHVRALHHHAGGVIVDQRGDIFGRCPA